MRFPKDLGPSFIPRLIQAAFRAALLSGFAAFSLEGLQLIAAPPASQVVAWGQPESIFDTWQRNPPSETFGHTIGVAAGTTHALALLDNGGVVTWGASSWSVLNVPPEATHDVIAIAAGNNFSVALTSSGSVLAWGRNLSGQTTVPDGAKSGVIQIACGKEHIVALRADGTVIAWGDNAQGQLDIPSDARHGIVAVGAGSTHSLAVTASGAVLSWGTAGLSPIPVPEAASSGVIAAAGGVNQSMALKSDGSVVAWGSPFAGPPPSEIGNRAIAVASGDDLDLVLQANGTVVKWGNTPLPELAKVYMPVSQISASGRYALGVMMIPRPVITNAPLGRVVQERRSTTFVVGAAGGFLEFQWSRDGTPIPKATNSSLTLSPVSFADAGDYTVVVSNPSGAAVNLPAARLVVTPFITIAPTITQAPQGATVDEGTPVRLQVVATGDDLKYQWYRNDAPMDQAIGPILDLGLAHLSDTGVYTVVVSNAAASVTNSGGTKVEIRSIGAEAPVIAHPLEAVSVSIGDLLRLEAKITGFPLSLQWQRNGVNIPGATNAVYRRLATPHDTEGTYSITATNFLGVATSSPWEVHTIPGTPPKPVGGVYDPDFVIPVPPEAQANVIAISRSAGFHRFDFTFLNEVQTATNRFEERLALLSNGTLVSWGYAQFNRNTPVGAPESSNSSHTGIVHRSDAPEGAIGIVASPDDALLLPNGTISGVDPKESFIPLAPQADADLFMALDGAQIDSTPFTRMHLLALRRSGAVAELDPAAIVPVAALTGIRAIAAGPNYSVALRSAGTVVAWQYPSGALLPIPEGLNGNITAIAAEPDGFATLIEDGTLRFHALTGATITIPPQPDTRIESGTPQFALTRDHRAVTWNGTAWAPAAVPVWAQGRILGRSGATLLVQEGPPVITRAPTSLTVEMGTPATLEISGGGAGVVYQWYRDGIPVENGTNAVLTIKNVVSADAGDYTVVLSNAAGTISNQVPARVTVTPAPWHQFAVAFSNPTNAPPEYITEGTTQIRSGYAHFLALRYDGAVVGWFPPQGFVPGTKIRYGGFDDRGQQNVPPQAQSGVVEIEAFDNWSLALRSDGSVVLWGGTGGSFTGGGEIAVSPPGRIRKVRGGAGQYFINEDGGVVFWDRALNQFTQDTIPLAARSGVVSLACQHPFAAFALKSDGTLVALSYDRVPPEVASGVVAVSGAGRAIQSYYVVAAKSDGTAWAWNKFGTAQLAGTEANVASIMDTTWWYYEPYHQHATLISATGHLVDLATPGNRPIQFPAAWQGRVLQVGGYSGSADVYALLSLKPQSLEFAPVSASRVSPDPIPLRAVSSSGLPVSYSVVRGPAVVSGTNLVITGAGTIAISAIQLGNDEFQSTGPVIQEFVIRSMPPELRWPELGSIRFGGSPASLVASVDNGLPVHFTVIDGPAVIEGGALRATGIGTVHVAADQVGDAEHPAAARQIQSVTAVPGIEIFMPPEPESMISLKVILPAGAIAAVEQSDVLGHWVQVGTVKGLGVDSPIFVPMTRPGEDTSTRFWRITAGE